jgi:hypothetical protein
MSCDICKGRGYCGRCKPEDNLDPAVREKIDAYRRTHCPILMGQSKKCLSCEQCAIIHMPGPADTDHNISL